MSAPQPPARNRFKQLGLPILAIGIPILALLLLFFEFRIADNQWKDVIASDGKGYYYYLIDNFVAAAERNPEVERTYLEKQNENYYTKYPVGTALLLTPFFAVAWVASIVFGYDLSGYSYPFQLLTGLGALFYLVLGCIALYKLLRTYALSTISSYFTVLVFAFGTNLLYYGVMAGSMSHVYSFSAIAMLALLVRKAFDKPSRALIIWSLFCFGLVVLIRPFNGLVIFAIPFLIADQFGITQKCRQIFRHKGSIALGLLGFGLLIFIQLLAWHNQTGSWILFSYAQEGFYFLAPKIVKVLFSFNKGLFVYTPLLLLSLVGLWFVRRYSMKAAGAFVVFSVVLTYFISSWWCWNYASGFGLRPFIDFYSIAAIPIGFLLHNSSKNQKKILAIALVVFCCLNLIQSYQYAVGILHHSSMNQQKYAYTFLKTNNQYKQSLGGSLDLPPYAKNGLQSISNFKLAPVDSTVTIATEFAASFLVNPSEVPKNAGQLFWEISMEKMEPAGTDTNKTLVVVDYTTDKGLRYYHTFSINHILAQPADQWQAIAHTLSTPAPMPGAKVKCYLWNRAKQLFELRNYTVQLCSPVN